MEDTHFNRDDRDLLVELRTEIIAIRADIKEIKDGTSITLADHEIRMRALETFKSVLMGGFILSNIVIVPILIWLVTLALKK